MTQKPDLAIITLTPDELIELDIDGAHICPVVGPPGPAATGSTIHVTPMPQGPLGPPGPDS